MEFAVSATPYVLVILALGGLVTGQKWLTWGVLASLALLFAATAACGIGLAVYLPFHMVRGWHDASLPEKVVLAATATFAVFGLGGILAAWIVTRR